jgi:hypothetical protein
MRRAVAVLVAVLFAPSAGLAQTETVTIPGNLILPNYERIPVGEREALEAGAFIARTSDGNSNWYNPAGLALVERTAVNTSAAAYDATNLEILAVRQKAGTLRFAPLGAFFGIVVAEPLTKSPNVRYGFYVARPISWQTGTIDEAEAITGQARFAVTDDATLTRMEPGLAIGARVNDHLRIGGALGVALTSLDQTQDLAVRYTVVDTASTTRRTFATGGTAWHLVPRVGLQWDAAERTRVGVVLAAPGISITGATRLSYTFSDVSNQDYLDVNVRDPEAELEYRIPFTAGVGVARLFSRGSIEATVRYYASTSEYDQFATDVTGLRTESIGGAPPTVTTVSLAPTKNRWREVTNLALGGNYALSDVFRLHLGIHTDSSPVADEESSLYRKIHLIGGTAGVSFTAKNYGGSLGLGYSAGRSDPIPSLAGLTANEIETRLRVSTFRVMYSFTARL